MNTSIEAEMDALYGDAVSLGDRARGWFDGPGRTWRAQLSRGEQAAVATESLAITARLMAVMAWLLDRGQARGGSALLRRLVIDTAGEAPIPAALQPQPGGEIALKSRQLVARAEALAATPGLWS